MCNKMTNLFFIYTPMQLLVAQQIINMKNLSDNIMLYGYIGDNSHFLEIYDLTIIDQLWSDKVLLPDLAQWASISRRHIFYDLVKTYRNFNYIKRLVNQYGIGCIYLGDINNYSNKFADIVFAKRNIEISFFEEGSSHYAFQDHFLNKKRYLPDYLLCSILDFLYFKPLFKTTYAKFCFIKDIRFDQLHISKRYSIRPYYHESYDEIITVSPFISEKLHVYIKNETEGMVCDNAVLFMTSPAYESLEYNDKDTYLKVIGDYFSSINTETIVYVKFHPREVGEVREKVLSIIEKNHQIIILGEKVNIPIEYYLQTMKFTEVVTFFSSTAFYNGFLFPQVRFVSLMQYYISQCCSSGRNRLRGDITESINVERILEKELNGYYISYFPKIKQ